MLKLDDSPRSLIAEKLAAYPVWRTVAFSITLKLVLFATLFACANTWDTSTQLLFSHEKAPLNGNVWALIKGQVAAKLMIWDNVYFIAQAKYHGPRFEHEFAFRNAWAPLIRLLSPGQSLTSLALTASAVSSVSHVGATVFLYYLSDIPQLRSVVDPAIAANLYTLCPAGIFLVSGYTESTFALLSFVGLLLLLKYSSLVLSALFFALSIQFRSNGLLWGSLYAVRLFGELLRPQPKKLFTIITTVVAGLIVLAGFLWPQVHAFYLYCPGFAWCSNTLPSIYLYVQAHYWNNGFLKYWTLPNLPNFVLAAPTLTLLVFSSHFLYKQHLVGLAAAQMLAFTGAICFWHVQIITRLASCFPGPYWYLASEYANPAKRSRAKLWIGFLFVWIVVQTALYGSFLPPA